MRWCRKENPKHDCLSTLKSLIGRRTVEVGLRDGLMFIDEVIRVDERDGAPVAVFSTGRAVAISDIDTLSGALVG
jgi:hypothetical protein